MAREVQVLVWCDPCQAEDKQTPGVELPPIGIGSAKPKILAMCEDHKVNFFDVFVEALNEFGLTADELAGQGGARRSGKGTKRAQSNGTARVHCPLAECGSTLKNVAGVASHLNNIHNTNFAETIGKDGVLFDTDGNTVQVGEVRNTNRRDQEPEVKRAECTECDEVFEWPEKRLPTQSLAVHLARSHGIRGKSKGSRARIAQEQQELKEAV